MPLRTSRSLNTRLNCLPASNMSTLRSLWMMPASCI